MDDKSGATPTKLVFCRHLQKPDPPYFRFTEVPGRQVFPLLQDFWYTVNDRPLGL